MSFLRIRSILLPFVTLLVIISVAAAVIAYGRGYRLDLSGKSLKPTGLLVVNSEPSGAQILIDGKLKTATPATLNLTPGWYTVSVVKEGFQPWEKRLRIQGEVVSRADSLLLPTNPGLTAITASGVANPILSPDGTKLAYVVPTPPATGNGNNLVSRPGVYVLELVDKPLGLNRDARQIVASRDIDFSQATLTWSPDSKFILSEIQPSPRENPIWYLLEVDKPNEPQLVPDVKKLRGEWQELKNLRTKEKLATLPQELIKVATTSVGMLEFSPDETKILYEATKAATVPQIIKPSLIGTNSTPETRELSPGKVYVYDLKEDKNYLTSTTTLPPLTWLPTSRHLLTVSKDKIEIMDYDGGNRRTFYAGPFWGTFGVPWTNATKIVILTNLNPSASATNNLYAVNLR